MIKKNQKLQTGDYFICTRREYEIILRTVHTEIRHSIKLLGITDGILMYKGYFLYRLKDNPSWCGEHLYNFKEFIILYNNTHGDIWIRGNKL